MSISDIVANTIAGNSYVSGDDRRFSYDGTKWTKQSNGQWKPANADAHTIYNHSTRAPLMSTTDIYGMVNRYRNPSNSQEQEKQTETISQGTLTGKQVLSECGVSRTASITWRGKKYNALDFWTANMIQESHGDSQVVNSIGCVGLMQINQPVHVKTHPTWTVEYLKDPHNNCRAAKILSGNWTNPEPWESATDGNFEQYIGQDVTITGSANSKGAGKPDTILEDVVDTTKNTVATLAGLATILFDPSTWLRGGKVLLGAAIILIVVYMAIRSAL